MNSDNDVVNPDYQMTDDEGMRDSSESEKVSL